MQSVHFDILLERIRYKICISNAKEKYYNAFIKAKEIKTKENTAKKNELKKDLTTLGSENELKMPLTGRTQIIGRSPQYAKKIDIGMLNILYQDHLGILSEAGP